MYRRRRILGMQQIETRNHSGERDEYWEERISGMQQLETVVLLSKGEVDSKKIRVEFSLEDMDKMCIRDSLCYVPDRYDIYFEQLQ